jgi:serine/threonine protein kinase
MEDEFEVVKKLGEGSYSRVWEAKNKLTGCRFAIKREGYIFNNLNTYRNILREI